MSVKASISPRISCALAVVAAAVLLAVEVVFRPGVDLGVLYVTAAVAGARPWYRRLGYWTASAVSAFALGAALLVNGPQPVLRFAQRLLLVLALWAILALQRRERRAEGVLHGEQTFRALLEAAPDAMVIVDEAGRIVLVNSQAEKLFGYERRELLGEPVERLIPSELRDRHHAHRKGFAAEPRPRTMGVGLELAALRKDGSAFPVEIALGPLANEGGMLVSAAIRDITERKRTERAQRDFLATLGHELRNPMASISNATRLLRHESVTPEQSRWSQEVIEAEGRHMTRLIDGLLDLSRVARNTIELRRERVDFARIADRVLESSRSLVEQRRHQLSASLPSGAVMLDADPIRLAQVLSNLVDNAAKYTPPGGRIAIAAAREGEWLVVRVRDNGIGVSPDALPRLFDMFYRADRSLEQQEGGLGIGLTLVRQLVELHGGSVEARSAGRGQGSEFTVRLPAEPAEPAATSRPEPVPAAAGTSGLRVLVVDDNRRAADSLALLLRLDGHQVETAYDGLEALRVSERFTPQAVLLDIGMPELNGYDTARRMRERNGGGSMLLVALTGLGTPEDRQRATEAGFDTHLVKPVDVDELGRLLADRCPR
jgi:PAS domain S-box-containing protein